MKLWPAWISMYDSDPRRKIRLETFVGDIMHKIWEDTPQPKPDYGTWWYGENGGYETIKNLIERLKV